MLLCIFEQISDICEFTVAIVELAAVDLLGKSHVREILDGK